jgi:predicted transposase/invertase (TIGR01784 family)
MTCIKTAGLPLSDKLEMHFYELTKLPETIDENDPMQRWLALFKAESTEELAVVEQMGDGEMAEAIVRLRKLTEDEKYRRLEDMRDEAAHEYASKLGGAYRRGVAAGEAENTLSIARLMKADGLASKTIAKYTGLKPEEVAGL